MPGDPDSQRTYYTFGSPIWTQLILSGSVSSQGSNHLLTLPQPSSFGECIWTAPVTYLVDSYSRCSLTLSASACTSSSRLSALMYIQTLDWLSANGSKILMTPSGSGTAQVNVTYLCANESYVNKYYLISTTNTSTSSDTVSNFGGSPEFYSNIPKPPPCPWNIYNSVPESPANVSNKCTNSVIDVLYKFSWNGTQILALNAEIILADLTIDPLSQLSQNFTVIFESGVPEVSTNVSATAGMTTESAPTTPGSLSNSSSVSTPETIVASGNPG